MARHATRKEKALAEKLRREIDSRPCRECGTPADEIPLDKCSTHAGATSLLDGLRNVNRTATRALDEAGVPDHLQGAGEEDWDSNDPEEWGH